MQSINETVGGWAKRVQNVGEADQRGNPLKKKETVLTKNLFNFTIKLCFIICQREGWLECYIFANDNRARYNACKHHQSCMPRGAVYHLS